jgi:hypothetical protein
VIFQVDNLTLTISRRHEDLLVKIIDLTIAALKLFDTTVAKLTSPSHHGIAAADICGKAVGGNRRKRNSKTRSPLSTYQSVATFVPPPFGRGLGGGLLAFSID